jgi:uncharacterized protein YqfB (UPF0267 family)
MEHLVYCDAKAKVLEKILNGTKTMIIRGSSGKKLPHGRVFEGDTLYLIESNDIMKIKATATVKSVFNSEKMTEDESKAVVAKNQDKLNLTDAQINRWAGKTILCLIEIKDVQPIKPLTLTRKRKMEDWIRVENISTVIEG